MEKRNLLYLVLAVLLVSLAVNVVVFSKLRSSQASSAFTAPENRLEVNDTEYDKYCKWFCQSDSDCLSACASCKQNCPDDSYERGRCLESCESCSWACNRDMDCTKTCFLCNKECEGDYSCTSGCSSCFWSCNRDVGCTKSCWNCFNRCGGGHMCLQTCEGCYHNCNRDDACTRKCYAQDHSVKGPTVV